MGLLKEFKEFALKGNVVDLAVGVIIGAAFGSIVKSLVDDVLMPPLGYLLGGADFSALTLTLKAAGPHPVTGNMMEAVVIRYGKFINSIIQFTIMAIAIFLMVKAMNRAMRKQAAAPAPPPGPTPDQQLLAEIRDLLKAGR